MPCVVLEKKKKSGRLRKKSEGAGHMANMPESGTRGGGEHSKNMALNLQYFAI